MDNNSIIKNYLIGGFLFDFLSTIPFDNIISWIQFNTSIIKSVKSIKFYKLFKFIKILRMSKAFSFLTTKYKYLQQEIGKEIWVFVKQLSSFSELLLHNI